MKELPIIKNRLAYFVFSGALTVAAMYMIAVYGFKLGIDFEGGTSWQIQFSQSGVSVDEVVDFFKEQGRAEVAVVPEPTTQSLQVRLDAISAQEKDALHGALKGKFGEFTDLRFDSIGPAIGSELKHKAIWATIMVLIGISFFVAYAFRSVSYPVSSWQYGAVTLVTLFHDVIIVVGLLAFLGKFFDVDVDSNSVVAVLVVLGFSVHDTIVVFDRIRENIRTAGSKIVFEPVVNKSVNETLARSINTSLTLVLVLIAMMLFGPISLRYFLVVLTVGVIFGTYSSIFIASPLLVSWHSWSKKKGK